MSETVTAADTKQRSAYELYQGLFSVADGGLNPRTQQVTLDGQDYLIAAVMDTAPDEQGRLASLYPVGKFMVVAALFRTVPSQDMHTPAGCSLLVTEAAVDVERQQVSHARSETALHATFDTGIRATHHIQTVLQTISDSPLTRAFATNRNIRGSYDRAVELGSQIPQPVVDQALRALTTTRHEIEIGF